MLTRAHWSWCNSPVNIGPNLDALDGFSVGDYATVKSGNFKGHRVRIISLAMAQYGTMKVAKAYAQVTFPAGNGWQFQLNNLRKD